jgi:hypothetical protein
MSKNFKVDSSNKEPRVVETKLTAKILDCAMILVTKQSPERVLIILRQDLCWIE